MNAVVIKRECDHPDLICDYFEAVLSGPPPFGFGRKTCRYEDKLGECIHNEALREAFNGIPYAWKRDK